MCERFWPPSAADASFTQPLEEKPSMLKSTYIQFQNSCNLGLSLPHSYKSNTSLTQPKFQKAMKKMMLKGIRGQKGGIDTSKYTLDQFKFVDDIKYPEGTKVGDIDPQLRRGHGLLLSKDSEAIAVAKEAFQAVAEIMDESGVMMPLYTSAVKADLRAVYLVAMDESIFAACADKVEEGTIWEYVKLAYDLPALPGLEIEKIMPSEGNRDTKILVLRLNSEWEWAVDKVGGGAGKDVTFRAIVGTITLKKRRAGPKQDPKSNKGAAAVPDAAPAPARYPRASGSAIPPAPPLPFAGAAAAARQTPLTHFSFTGTSGTLNEANVVADGEDEPDEFDQVME